MLRSVLKLVIVISFGSSNSNNGDDDDGKDVTTRKCVTDYLEADVPFNTVP
jgi:hypothetical protein